MNRSYHPSGKVSILLIPVYLVLIFFTAVAAAICIIGARVAPSALRGFAVYLIVAGFLTSQGSRFCIRAGKVRNKTVAFAAGLSIICLFWYFLLVFHIAVPEVFFGEPMQLGLRMTETLKNVIIHPFLILEPLKALLENGFLVSGKSGTALFTIGGKLAFLILAGVFLVTAGIMIYGCCQKSRLPFCEESKRWGREISLTFEIPEEEEVFFSSLLLGDTGVLASLQPLSTVNVNYVLVTLYAMVGNSVGLSRDHPFYISVTKRIISGGKPDIDGEISYEDEELVRFLAVDSSTGLHLLSTEEQQPEEVTVRVITREAEKKAHRKFFLCAAGGILLIGFSAYCILKMEEEASVFLNSGGFFYIAAIFLTGAVNLVKSFQKNRVVIGREDQAEYEAVRRYLVEERELPLFYRCFYIALMLGAVFLFLLCIYL